MSKQQAFSALPILDKAIITTVLTVELSHMSNSLMGRKDLVL